jgi:hypothetical protein
MRDCSIFCVNRSEFISGYKHPVFPESGLPFATKSGCSGLIAPGTLIRDNSSLTLRCQYEQKTTV